MLLCHQISQKGGVAEDKLDLASDAFWIWTFVGRYGGSMGVNVPYHFLVNNSFQAPKFPSASKHNCKILIWHEIKHREMDTVIFLFMVL